MNYEEVILWYAAFIFIFFAARDNVRVPYFHCVLYLLAYDFGIKNVMGICSIWLVFVHVGYS